MNIIDIFFPPRCMACSQVIAVNKKGWFCDNEVCSEPMQPIRGRTCGRCGIGIETERSLCKRCTARESNLTFNYGLFVYEGKARQIVHNLKYVYGPAMKPLIVSVLEKNLDMKRLEKIDCIVPVPMYRRKKRSRGYNQAELLGEAIAEVTGIPLIKKAIARRRSTVAQSKLGYKQREKNLSNAFKEGEDFLLIKAKAILLIDDIYTTGSTMNECSKVLLGCGADSVTGFTFTVTAFYNKDV